MFALFRHLGINPIDVDIRYKETNEPIFEFDLRNQEPMIPSGVKHLVECLNEKWQSECSGEFGRQCLALALQFKEEYERNK